MAQENRSKDLLVAVVNRLRGDFSVTNRLPDGADDIHPAPVPRPRDTQVDLVVKPIAAGGGTRRGPNTQATRVLQIRVEVASDYFESKPTSWLYELFDAIEDALEGVGGAGRAPDGRGAGLGPVFDENRGRYLADQTYRYLTIN